MRLIGHKSLTLRLTLLFATVSTVVLLLLGLIVGTLVERHFEELDMEVLGGKLELLQHALAKVRSLPELDALPAQLETSLVGHHGLTVTLLTPGGRLLFASGGAEFPPSLLSAAGQVPATPALWTGAGNRHFRGIAVQAKTQIAGAPPAIVAVATDTAHHEHFMHSFQLALWSVVGLAALASGLLGWLATRRGLAPIDEIRRKAADITADRLDHRLSADSIPVELAEVVRALNEMLARLEESFRRLTDFSSDLAHELRTPVSNLLTQTQVILSRGRTTEEYAEVLASNVEEFERLSRMIADMLFLAKADNALVVPRRERVALHTEAGGLLEFYDALAEEKQIRLTLVGHATVSGDRLMLRRAIGNLLSNAFRHTPTGGCIAIRIDGHEDGTARLTVENTGDTVMPQHLPRLFDRFYRVEASRHRLADGAGLGLAITRSILRAHGGEASVNSRDGVTTFELRFPA